VPPTDSAGLAEPQLAASSDPSRQGRRATPDIRPPGRWLDRLGARTADRSGHGTDEGVEATARLASMAAAGEALVSEAAALAAGFCGSGSERPRLELRGRLEPMDVVVVRGSA